jgi:hypothetical protein
MLNSNPPDFNGQTLEQRFFQGQREICCFGFHVDVLGVLGMLGTSCASREQDDLAPGVPLF